MVHLLGEIIGSVINYVSVDVFSYENKIPKWMRIYLYTSVNPIDAMGRFYLIDFLCVLVSDVFFEAIKGMNEVYTSPT